IQTPTPLVAGAEVQVNTTVTGPYLLGGQSSSSVGVAANGDYVVTWVSDNGSTTRILAQRFSSAGGALGGEFTVANTTGAAGNTSTPNTPKIAVAADGSFVISWQAQQLVSFGPAGYTIYAQRYSAAGAALGGPQTVFSFSFTGIWNPQATIAAGPAGTYLVSW